MSKKRKLREESIGSLGRVDRENGIIKDVAILGSSSMNNRVYEDSALHRAAELCEGAAELCEGAAVRIDHNPDDRSLTDDIGVLKNVKIVDGKVRGDLHLNLAHPQAMYICERAEKFPRSFGLSIDGDGVCENGPDGKEHVIDLVHIESVDLVTNPATNKSLFEEIQMTTSRRRRIQKPSRLREMISDSGDDQDNPIEESSDTELIQQITEILSGTSSDDAGKIEAIRALLGEPSEDDEMNDVGQAPAGTGDLQESVRREFSQTIRSQSKQIQRLYEENQALRKKAQKADSEREVRKLCEECGIESLTESQMLAATSLSGDARRAYVSTIAEVNTAGGTVRSSGSGKGSHTDSFDELLEKTFTRRPKSDGVSDFARALRALN